MPRKKQPPHLEDLAIQAVGRVVTEVGRHFLEPLSPVSQRYTVYLQANVDRLKELFNAYVPWYLSDKVAEEVLSSIVKLMCKTINNVWEYQDFFEEGMDEPDYYMNVVSNLSEVVLHSRLRHIAFPSWPLSINHILYNNLDKLTGLKCLDLGCTFSTRYTTVPMENTVLCGFKSMKNLTSLTLCLYCTDHILRVVILHCSMLQKLNVESSRNVTDHSVCYLLSCCELRELNLQGTSISIEGLATILMGLPLLENFGNEYNFVPVLKHIRSISQNNGPFCLRSFYGVGVTDYEVNLLVEMCPKITCINISNYHVVDVSVLSALVELTELRLNLYGEYSTDNVNVKQLLEMKGSNLTWLSLASVEIDLNAVSQFCPNLKTLKFSSCKFLQDESLSTRKLTVPPFQKLERIVYSGYYSQDHLIFLFSYCFNIKFIKVFIPPYSMEEETLVKILLLNPLKELEEFNFLLGSNLSMQAVHMLMTRCTNLRVLSRLQNWKGISKTELADFKLSLMENNIDLNVF